MFSFKKLNNHYDNGLLKDHLDAKEYIEKYMCPLTNGEHAVFEEGKVTIVPEGKVLWAVVQSRPSRLTICQAG
jgi:hypothetical protein